MFRSNIVFKIQYGAFGYQKTRNFRYILIYELTFLWMPFIVIKGTVSQDFRPLVSFIKQSHLGP
jgi:hypothetical protein